MAGSFFPGFMDNDHLHKVRNPSGGNTNDIFDLEKRQRQRKLIVYEEKEVKKDKTIDKEDPRKSLETEDILNPLENANRKLRRSLSDCNIKQTAGRTPPLAVGKENLGTHFKGSLSPRIPTMTESEVKVIDESEGEDDELLISEKPKRNPITGEGMEDVPPIKLEDTTNTDKQEDAAAKQDSEDLEKKKPRRPCIRVRQPPGGKSSIIF